MTRVNQTGSAVPQDAHDGPIGALWPVALLTVAVLAYAIVFSQLTLTRYAAFEARALDMGNLVQAIWNTAQGNWFHLTNQPGIVNRLSLHVEPIIIPISWLYRIYSDPATLLILQASIVALGAIPLFALGRLRLRNDWLALVFSIAFLLNPSIQAANWLEFHPVTLAPTFFLAAFYFLLADRRGWYALFLVLAVSCKEELALIAFMIGLYAWLARGQRRLGMVTMFLALLWAFFAVFVIQDLLGAGNIHWERYAYLGDGPLAMASSLVLRPGLIFSQLQTAQALRYIFLLLLPVGFTSLLAPEVLALALPSLAINLLADFAPMHQVDTLIYAAPIVPFVMMSGLIGAGRLLDRRASGRSASAAGATRGSQAAVAALVLGCAIGAQIIYGYLPGMGNYLPLQVTEHHRRGTAIIEQIAAEAGVSAQDRLNPHVSQRRTLYIFPRLEDADTVLVDVTGPAWPQHPNDLYDSVQELLAAGFGVAAADHGYLLLQKSAPAREIPDSFYDVWRLDSEPRAVEGTVLFGDSLELIDYRVTTDRYGELVVQLSWRLLKPLQEDLRFYIAYTDANGDPMHDSRFYPPVASLWYPTSRWEVEQPVIIQTLPWALAADRFGLVLGLYRGTEGWENGDRLPITMDRLTLPLLEGATAVRLGGYERTKRGDWLPLSPTTEIPEMPLDLTFGGEIRLNGATIQTPTLSAGEDLALRLYWEAVQTPALDYSIFAHLVDEDGMKVAQLDWQPRDEIGPLPASSWAAGQILIDEERLEIPAATPAGDYQLIVGIYDWQSGRRLPLTGPKSDPGDFAALGTVRVE